jgi:hypothetical protein
MSEMRTKIPIWTPISVCALLLLLPACHGRVSNPVEPEGAELPGVSAPAKGGGGKSQPATLDLAPGMETTILDVTMKESGKKLNVGNSAFVHAIQMNFASPGFCFGFKATKSGVVPTPDEITALKEELETRVTAGFFTMQIDKNSLGSPSDGHLLLVERDGTFEGANGYTRIQLGSPFDQVDSVTVTQPDPDKDVFEFTGPVVVWAHGVGGGRGEKSNRIIACPGVGSSPNQLVATVSPTL